MLVGVNLVHSGAGSAYSDNFKLPHTDSFDAVRLLQRNAPKASGDTEEIVIAVTRGRVTDPAARARVGALLTKVAAAPHVSIVRSPYAVNGAGQIAPSGRVAFADVTFDVPSNEVSVAAAKRFVSKVITASGNGVQFQVEGQIATEGDTGGGTSGLALGFIAAAVVLFVAFGSLLAMALPLLTAGVSLGNRDRDRRAAVARHGDEFLLRPARAADRARRRSRLRAVHRDPLSARACCAV